MRPIHILPLLLFAALTAALFVGMGRNPSIVPTVMINKPVPSFSLPPVRGELRGLSSGDLARGRVSIVNIFASWCVPCRAEHAQLTTLAKSGEADLFAIDYKDAPGDARHYLDVLGDPFKGIGADIKGRVAIDWGSYGVPETYIVNGKGQIIYRHVGPIMPDDIQAKIMPAIREARK
jgi:cytochrome c biogenesis protein CcmG/thiol:disulfide interchange protein DsbE